MEIIHETILVGISTPKQQITTEIFTRQSWWEFRPRNNKLPPPPIPNRHPPGPSPPNSRPLAPPPPEIFNKNRPLPLPGVSDSPFPSPEPKKTLKISETSTEQQAPIAMHANIFCEHLTDLVPAIYAKCHFFSPNFIVKNGH